MSLRDQICTFTTKSLSSLSALLDSLHTFRLTEPGTMYDTEILDILVSTLERRQDVCTAVLLSHSLPVNLRDITRYTKIIYFIVYDLGHLNLLLSDSMWQVSELPVWIRGLHLENPKPFFECDQWSWPPSDRIRC
jgi:hypothetical protein